MKPTPGNDTPRGHACDDNELQAYTASETQKQEENGGRGIGFWPNGLGCNAGETELMLQLVGSGRLAVWHQESAYRQRVAMIPYALTAATRVKDIPLAVLAGAIEYCREHGKLYDDEGQPLEA